MQVRKMTSRAVWLAAALAAAISVLPHLLVADPTLPEIISNHMVLQAGRDLPIWGWAEPGEAITVAIETHSRSTTADGSGHWKVVLPPLEPGGPWRMTVRGRKTITLEDILVGEVWLCSGQSNMQFELAGTDTAAREIAAADYPQIRVFNVPKESSLEPLDNTHAGWRITTPEVAGEFSAVAYFFGRELHRELGVPVGLITSSWGGTNAEEWTEHDALRREPDFAPILSRWEQTDPEVKELYTKPFEFELWFDDFELIPAKSPPGTDRRIVDDFDDGNLRNQMGGNWSYDGSPAVPGTHLDLPQPGHGGSGRAARVAGHFKVGELSILHASYRREETPVDLSAYQGIRFYARGKGFFKFHSLQPTVTDWDNYAAGTFRASSEWAPLTILFKDLKQAGWGKKLPFTREALTGFLIEKQIAMSPPPRPPAGLFNGMINPLIPFAVRGAAWYQGEGNAGRAHQYRKLLPTLIRSWRNAWGSGAFPFLIVQLPSFLERKPQPSESAWAELREAQLMALATPSTGLAVTIDQGEADDVHPRRKIEVGRRLALWALGTTYGRDLVYSGPLFHSMSISGKTITVRFKHVGSGLVACGGRPLKGFAVAGADKNYHWAQGRIDGDNVIVWSDRVPNPVAVRYAWADNPECNLYNNEGLPASPFRTDRWPGITVGKD
jgi:sialate O-acetylesterase